MRISDGIIFLNNTWSETLAIELLQKESKPPSRPRIHFLLSRTHIKLRDRRRIKLQRLTGCRREVFEEYFQLISHIISTTSPYLIFGADETMLETLLGTKVVVPDDISEACFWSRIISTYFSDVLPFNYGRGFPSFHDHTNNQIIPTRTKSFHRFQFNWCSMRSFSIYKQRCFFVLDNSFIEWNIIVLLSIAFLNKIEFIIIVVASRL